MPVHAEQRPSGPSDMVSVYLASGRTFEAALDAKTDAARLWLRFGRGGAEVLRPIRWDRVVRAKVAGKTLSGADLHRLVVQIRQDTPVQPIVSATSKNIVMVGSPKATWSEPNHAAKEARQRKTPRVVSLAIDATAANWDDDVEVDGLLVHVYPLDAEGETVSVHGTLQVNLKAEKNGVGRPRPRFVEAGYWSQRVRPDDFGSRGAVYRLQFQGIHPEFDASVASLGAVHARLAVPGQGTFEATAAMVQIRPYSVVRDHRWQTTGRRFFADERTGDGRR